MTGNMELRQLEIFISVAKNLSFSKAAGEMYISQPSVSAQIIMLEKELGLQLLIRNSKGVTLTKSGRELLLRAQKILALRDQAVSSVRGEDKNAAGMIDIISSTIPAQHLLPDIIASFKAQWPNIVFRVEQADSGRVEQEMRSFRFDFGMTGAAPDSDRFTFYPVYEDEFVLVLPKRAQYNGDLSGRDFIEFMLGSPFIMRETGSGTRREIEGLLSRIGVDLRELKVPAYFSDAHSILLAVSRGMGVSLISKVAAEMFVNAGLVRAVGTDDPLFRRQIFILHNQEIWLSPIQQAFADHARRHFLTGSAAQPDRL